MTIEEILAGESQRMEFKESLPEKSHKYMKTVVAFANGKGGKIVFGVADQTNEITGIDDENVFSVMDKIANAISDSCEPAIIPDITMQTIEGKTIVIVEVASGKQRPYYVKALGREQGIYVRVAGTTRLADEYMIRELMFEGSNRCFDQSICMDLQVTDQDIDALCHALKAVAVKNAANDEQKAAVKDVTKRQLLSWGVLVEKEGLIYPTNAYAVLTGSEVIPVVIQCGVFKGKTKAVFVDRREFSGPLYEQIEQAYQFVLRNIRLGATFNGLYRQDVYEIPTDAIRELIINAVVHRSYLDRGNIQVAIYDDRLEVTSPGKLPIGQTVERMKEGYSKIRNEALANAFSYMNLIEHWGSGIPRIVERVKEAGLREPEFIDGDIDLRINIYRAQIEMSENASDSETVQKEIDVNDGDGDGDGDGDENRLNDNEKNVYAKICEDASLTAAKIAEELGISKPTVERTIRLLKGKGYIVREGGARNGKWVAQKQLHTAFDVKKQANH